jgi:hypothetical protein
MKTLKTGCSAFYDSSVGLVPVKVLSVTAPATPNFFDLGHGYARASIKVTAEVTEEYRPYEKGDLVESNSLHIVPRGAVIRGRFSSAIGVYDVVPDARSSAGAAPRAPSGEN